MKKRVFTIIAALVLLAASVYASEPSLYYSREGMYTFYRIDTLKDSGFEFYFSIDTCTDMEEYIRIRYPNDIINPTTGSVSISSSNGEHTIKMEGAIQPDEKGYYLNFTIGEDDGEKASYILRGENISVSITDASGKSYSIKANQKGLNKMSIIHEEYYR